MGRQTYNSREREVSQMKKLSLLVPLFTLSISYALAEPPASTAPASQAIVTEPQQGQGVNKKETAAPASKTAPKPSQPTEKKKPLQAPEAGKLEPQAAAKPSWNVSLTNWWKNAQSETSKAIAPLATSAAGLMKQVQSQTSKVFTQSVRSAAGLIKHVQAETDKVVYPMAAWLVKEHPKVADFIVDHPILTVAGGTLAVLGGITAVRVVGGAVAAFSGGAAVTAGGEAILSAVKAALPAAKWVIPAVATVAAATLFAKHEIDKNKKANDNQNNPPAAVTTNPIPAENAGGTPSGEVPSDKSSAFDKALDALYPNNPTMHALIKLEIAEEHGISREKKAELIRLLTAATDLDKTRAKINRQVFELVKKTLDSNNNDIEAAFKDLNEPPRR